MGRYQSLTRRIPRRGTTKGGGWVWTKNIHLSGTSHYYKNRIYDFLPNVDFDENWLYKMHGGMFVNKMSSLLTSVFKKSILILEF